MDWQSYRPTQKLAKHSYSEHPVAMYDILGTRRLRLDSVLYTDHDYLKSYTYWQCTVLYYYCISWYMYCEHTNASLNTEATCRRYTTPPHSTFSEFTEAIKVQTTTALVAQVYTRECLMSNVVKCLRMFPFQCNWNCILNVLCVPERKTQNSLQNSCQILNQFSNSFSLTNSPENAQLSDY